jgi:hypothetical protein
MICGALGSGGMSDEFVHNTENTRMPRGSSLLLPTGNRRRRLCRRHPTNLLVLHTMIVLHNKSSAESTREAIRDSDGEK